MANTFLLVHSPLVGPESWEPAGAVLVERGQKVVVADLAPAFALGPPFLPRMAEAIAALDTGPAILVGHSRAGPLLPVLGRAAAGVNGYLFVDSRLPHPGRSWLQASPPEQVEQLRAMSADGWLPPWPRWWGDTAMAELLPDADVRNRFVAGCPQLPFALLDEVHPEAPGWPDSPCGYLLLSEAYRQPAEEARSAGWPVVELASNHLGLITDPESVATSLLDLADRLATASPPRA